MEVKLNTGSVQGSLMVSLTLASFARIGSVAINQ